VLSHYGVAGHWSGDLDEAALQAWAEGLRRELHAPAVTLGLVFLTPALFDRAAQVLEVLRVHAQVPLLIGCSSTGLVAGGEEHEEDAGLVLGLYHLPGADLRAVHFTPAQVEAADGPGYWPVETGVSRAASHGWLVFADPFHLDGEAWLQNWNAAYAPAPTYGGLASGHPATPRTQVYLNGEVWEEGGVALSVGGEVGLAGVISQGCTPIGDPWTITRVSQNIIQQIANRPAYELLVETFNALPADQQQKSRGHLFVGLVVDEYQEDFRRGDFLIRNLLGADPHSGAIAVGALPRAGQSIQFQRRDAAAASEDLAALLVTAQRRLRDTTIYGGCLCSCNGRGRRFFAQAHHDARQVRQCFGNLGLTGFFCNGEIGPVGDRAYLHGYTAALALFVKR
jgi:small ligand-binding sensory domain FIST